MVYLAWDAVNKDTIAAVKKQVLPSKTAMQELNIFKMLQSADNRNIPRCSAFAKAWRRKREKVF
jgi:hypothetical protein